MFRLPGVVALAVCVVACAGSHRTTSEPAAAQAPEAGKANTSSAQKKKQVRTPATRESDENTTADSEPSVFSQGNDEIDLDLTQRIRKQLVADDALSFSAKNVKIIAQDGMVTLRGSVKSEAEAKEVRKKAVAEAGQGRVQDHLEVSP